MSDVDPKVSGLISLATHEQIVNELTDALKITAEHVGQDLLPAWPGFDWYSALVKYAPDKAALFTDKDPLKEIFPYAVLVIDRHEGKTLADSSETNIVGVIELLDQLTSLDRGAKTLFKERLQTTGCDKYYGQEAKGERYNIFAVVRSKYAMDSRGALIKLDRYGRAIN